MLEVEPLEDDFIQQEQTILDVTITEFLTHKHPLTFRQSSAYQACETLCLLGREPDLLQRLREQTKTHLQHAVNVLFESAETTTDQRDWLTQLLDFWNAVDRALTSVEFVMAPLDRGYILNSDDESIRRIVQKQLSRALVYHEKFLPWTLQGFLGCMSLHRTKEIVMPVEQQSRLSQIVLMLDCLELYAGEFEQTLLTASRSFYETEGNTMMANPHFSASSYIKHICHRLQDETAVISPILLPHTVPALTTLILDELLRKHSSKILYGATGEPVHHEGLYDLVIREDLDALKQLYSLFLQTGSRVELKDAWHAVVKAEGFRLLQENIRVHSSSAQASGLSSLSAFLQSIPSMEAIGRGSQQKTLIYDLIKFKLLLVRIQSEVFNNSEDFDLAVKDAWVSFLNATPDLANIVACLVGEDFSVSSDVRSAKYADELLRGGGLRSRPPASTPPAPDDIDIHIDRFISIFKFLQAKDVFKDLGRRLLLGRAASLDHEKLLVKKLRSECGPTYTSRMESMFRELELSKATFTQFKQDTQAAAVVASTGLQFDCRVLAAGIWPTQTPSTSEPSLPPVMVTLQQTYTAFYEKLQKGRLLQWAPSLGTCVVRATYEGDRKHDLVVSQYQALCLLQFNDTDTLTVDEISTATNISAFSEGEYHHHNPGVDELQRHLLALYVDPKRRILLKSPEATRELCGTDRYTINKEFTSKLLRVVITQIMLKESKEEVEQAEQRVEEDRTYHIDALIVRLMKANKTMQHNALMSDVLQSLLFKATPAIIKARIEALIDREFIGRDPQAPHSYHYIA